ncbi:putative effector protein [Ceratobasidium theobromae]|uniref:Putative effector protein n=1 Tax=Ceratobasidium theobromae TaxID=1582974 RepID=A0A5N5QES1_9AGAM|nr:putative effector protein [Ceratobasidium theobromae]
MQLFNLLTLAGASFFAFSGVQGAGNGFSGTCKDIRMKVDSNTVLQASCRKVDGSYTTSTLDLNKCIVNRNGYLQIQANGNFGNSCYFCGYDNGNFRCSCTPGPIISSVWLDSCVGNNDGQLFC